MPSAVIYQYHIHSHTPPVGTMRGKTYEESENDHFCR